jgi:hypothetical protein
MNTELRRLARLVFHISGKICQLQTWSERFSERLGLVEARLDTQASDRYWRAYEEWKKRDRDLGVSIDGSQRFARDEAHER